MASERTWNVLLVEDLEPEAALFCTAAEECADFRAKIDVLANSKDMVVYLRRAHPYENAMTPDLVVLDYKMPVDGGIALTEIKGDPDFMHTPVTVLTGSDNPRDYRDAYARHANCCFRKPTNYTGYKELICYLADLWFKRCVLPPPVSSRPPGML